MAQSWMSAHDLPFQPPIAETKRLLTSKEMRNSSPSSHSDFTSDNKTSASLDALSLLSRTVARTTFSSLMDQIITQYRCQAIDSTLHNDSMLVVYGGQLRYPVLLRAESTGPRARVLLAHAQPLTGRIHLDQTARQCSP